MIAANGSEAALNGFAYTPVLQRVSEIPPRRIDWLWPGRIARGRITVMAGQAGLGKSVLSADIAARITAGGVWPDGCAGPHGSVIMLAAEDDPEDTIRPRLDVHGADSSKVYILPSVRSRDRDGICERPITLADVGAIESALKQVPDCQLIIVDPIGSYLGARTDAHRDNEVRAVLSPLAALAKSCGVAVLLVAHHRKSAGGTADDMVMGSRAFTGIARSAWHLARDRENHGRILLLPGKNNISAQSDGLAFSISTTNHLKAGTQPHVRWERDPVKMTADDALAEDRRPHGPKPDARKKAGEWLKAALASGPLPSKELDDAAIKAGLSIATLRRAKKDVGVVPTPVGGAWVCGLA